MPLHFSGEGPLLLDAVARTHDNRCMDEQKPIVILGGGNMGGALAVRWHTARLAPVHVVEKDPERRAALAEFGIIPHATLAEAPREALALVLAIKPQQFAAMVDELTAYASAHMLLISILAGTRIAALQQISERAVRVMPNLPAQIGESMSVGYAPATLDAQDRARAELWFETVGQFAWVEQEELLHSVTAISGSGPAYVFAFMEALEAAAITQGLDAEIARQLVRQTVRGAALLADGSQEDVATLRRNVTSPGGTTEAALKIFEQGQLADLIKRASAAAAKRSGELSP